MIQQWGPFISSALELFGAILLLVEWVIAFKPPFAVYPVGLNGSQEEDELHKTIARRIDVFQQKRSWLVFFGYLFLGIGLLLACYTSYPK
jgi:hypothetical protein